MPERPNVLLILFDTARADAFSPYNAGRNTPAVADLASRGVAYPRAVAPSCWTVPSHGAFFLGSPPRSVGLSRPPLGTGTLCAPVIEDQRERYLPDVLRTRGYSTAGASANLWISKHNGFDLGFETFHEFSGHRVGKMSTPSFRARLRWYREAIEARADDGAQAIGALLDGWIRARPRAPFFWFVNLLECHSPYLPPRPANDLGPLGRVLAAEDARRHQTFDAVVRAVARGTTASPRSLRRMRHLYDRSVELLDRWLARVLELLDAQGILDDTVVIVTSDHGDNFGENGLIGHGGSLDDRLLSVPLVAAGPGVPAAAPPIVSLVDLPRMIAGFIGMDDDPWGPPADPGVALAQYDGTFAFHPDEVGALREIDATPDGIRRLTQRFTCATDGALKLVRTSMDELLYDVTSDPLETAPVDPSTYPAERLEPLRRALDRATSDAWDPDESVKDRVRVEQTSDEVSDIEERMKLLGYL